MAEEKARRRRLLIDPAFQGMFAVYAVATTLIMVPLFLAANFYFFNLFAHKAQSVGLPPEHELLLFVERQRTLMIVVFLLSTTLALMINVVFSYIFSNRIAGSLYRLKSVMNQTNDLAQAKEVVPRDADFFKDLYSAYNQLLERFRT